MKRPRLFLDAMIMLYIGLAWLHSPVQLYSPLPEVMPSWAFLLESSPSMASRKSYSEAQ